MDEFVSKLFQNAGGGPFDNLPTTINVLTLNISTTEEDKERVNKLMKETVKRTLGKTYNKNSPDGDTNYVKYVKYLDLFEKVTADPIHLIIDFDSQPTNQSVSYMILLHNLLDKYEYICLLQVQDQQAQNKTISQKVVDYIEEKKKTLNKDDALAFYNIIEFIEKSKHMLEELRLRQISVIHLIKIN
jgi:hypothetical protein